MYMYKFLNSENAFCSVAKGWYMNIYRWKSNKNSVIYIDQQIGFGLNHVIREWVFENGRQQTVQLPYNEGFKLHSLLSNYQQPGI